LASTSRWRKTATGRRGCLTKGQNCGGYTLRGGSSPSFRGLMTWSINWGRYYNWEFQNSHAPYLAALP
jgi:chitinase